MADGAAARPEVVESRLRDGTGLPVAILSLALAALMVGTGVLFVRAGDLGGGALVAVIGVGVPGTLGAAILRTCYRADRSGFQLLGLVRTRSLPWTEVRGLVTRAENLLAVVDVPGDEQTLGLVRVGSYSTPRVADIRRLGLTVGAPVGLPPRLARPPLSEGPQPSAVRVWRTTWAWSVRQFWPVVLGAAFVYVLYRFVFDDGVKAMLFVALYLFNLGFSLTDPFFRASCVPGSELLTIGRSGISWPSNESGFVPWRSYYRTLVTRPVSLSVSGLRARRVRTATVLTTGGEANALPPVPGRSAAQVAALIEDRYRSLREQAASTAG